MKNLKVKRFLALALLAVSLISIALPAMAMQGDYTKYLGTYTLRRGNTGQAVRNLQYMLNTIGYPVGAVDGIFGSNTENAVELFQRDFNLSVDGECGYYTKNRLWQVLPVLPSGVQEL